MVSSHCKIHVCWTYRKVFKSWLLKVKCEVYFTQCAQSSPRVQLKQHRYEPHHIYSGKEVVARKNQLGYFHGVINLVFLKPLYSVHTRFDPTLDGPQKSPSQRFAMRSTTEVPEGGAFIKCEYECMRPTKSKERK